MAMQKMVIYTSELLRTTKNTACVAEAIHNTLESLQIEHRELKNTNDYWCRDYMPVLLSDDGVYAKYKYNPDYLKDYIKNDEKLTEKNKEINPIEWTKLMNNYKNTAEEIVLKEYIFA